MNFFKDRAKQLRERILILSQNHKEFHHKCFKSETPIYDQIQNRRSEYIQKELKKSRELEDILQDENLPISWENSKEKKYLNKSSRILSQLRNELLAINYYNSVRNCKYTFRMIEQARKWKVYK